MTYHQHPISPSALGVHFLLSLVGLMKLFCLLLCEFEDLVVRVKQLHKCDDGIAQMMARTLSGRIPCAINC
ncbi:hypothetical protein N657DRAFT_642693 [Parathielavia appendiculata]|uniref:Uncharacterized protein n=1 Tax=Parathielavia appendiculata TaxID=2587402 RepID=A0AAN6U3S6_9PEZI|nr:hypothetical protein N657DRAFT_642693 [Parathielavia appendiculata]